MTIFYDLPGVYQRGLIFWSITEQPNEAHKATIPQMMGIIHTFHMRHVSTIFTKWLQKYISSLTLNNSCIVEYVSTCYYDYLEIRDGPSADHPILDKLCGNETASILSSQNQLWIR